MHGSYVKLTKQNLVYLCSNLNVRHHRNNNIVEDSRNKLEVPKEMCTTSKLSLSGHKHSSRSLFKHDFESLTAVTCYMCSGK